MMACEFYLGTHEPSWLARAGVPLFVSARRLRRLRRRLPRAVAPWALDSGGFSELSLFGGWRTSAKACALEALWWMRRIGGMRFACPQDWMCEPFVLEKTGLTVDEHQARTVASYLQLRALAPSVPWLPVLQGYTRDDYFRCWDRYAEAGVDLERCSLVGLGSVCRRQATREAEAIVRELAGAGLKLHGFGFKTLGLTRVGHLLASADSMAWSLAARRAPPLEGCPHKNCANCLEYALAWRGRGLREAPGRVAAR